MPAKRSPPQPLRQLGDVGGAARSVSRLTGPTSCLDIASLKSRFVKRTETRRIAVSFDRLSDGRNDNLARPCLARFAHARDRAVANQPTGLKFRGKGRP